MATEKACAPDATPNVRVGVTTEYPHGYAGPAVLLAGRLSEVFGSANAKDLKLPQGFQPERWTLRMDKVPDWRYGFGKGLAPGDSVNLSIAHKVMGTDGVIDDDPAAAAFTTVTESAILKGDFDGSDSDSEPDEGSGTACGLVKAAALSSPAVVADDVSYAKVTFTGTLNGDADVELLIYLKQVDPRPAKMF